MPPEQGALPSQPSPGETSVNLRIDYPERLSRWLLFVKWLFVIPAYIVLLLYGIAVFITTFISFWAILFTGRYPGGLFDFARGYLALYARTIVYFPLLLTDRYPLASRLEAEEEVRYEVEDPERLSRWLLLLKLASLLLGVVGTLTSIAGFVLLLAAIPAWFAILFTGRYPRGMFDFMVAVAQWIARVTGWQYLMRDEWSLFATTQGIGVLVGAGAVAVAGLTIVNYATGGFEFETGEDQNGVRFIEDLLETPAAMTEEEEEGTTAPTIEPMPTAPTIEPTPTTPPTPTISRSQLTLEDAPYYLDAGAVLPGFKQVDPQDEGMSNADLGLGPDFSEVVLYLSEEPFQITWFFMAVVSGEIEKASEKALLRDEEALEAAFLVGFTEAAAGGDEALTDIQWSDPPVGDLAKRAVYVASFEGVEVPQEFLLFYQEEGREAAEVFVMNIWLPGEPPTVDTLTIAQHISDKIANR